MLATMPWLPSLVACAARPPGAPCCPRGRSGRWRWARPPLAHRTTWTRTRTRTWSPPRTWCSSAHSRGCPSPSLRWLPEHPAALPHLNGGVCDALPLLGPWGLAIGRGRLMAPRLGARHPFWRAACDDFGARPATILATRRHDDRLPATTTDWRVLRWGQLRPLRFGRGTGGPDLSGRSSGHRTNGLPFFFPFRLRRNRLPGMSGPRRAKGKFVR
jgi:hypothetical protein